MGVRRISVGMACVVVVFVGLIHAPSAMAEAPANDAFAGVWARTDRPVAEGMASRTWMWGPEAFTGEQQEPYAESPEGQRTVQYYDKSRMEITSPAADPDSLWYVTNGLLVVELVTGRLQLGNTAFQQREPAQVNVAGDADDPAGPTYATIRLVREQPPLADGALVTQRLARDGTLSDDPSLAAWGVRAAQHVQVAGIDHQIAAPFWEFMNSTGVVYQDASYNEAQLFIDPYYATGYPIAEAYWATVKVGGTPRDVLMQCFERRCLTYTPDNPPGWQVEAGNVGRHYYTWRYPAPDDGGSDDALHAEVIEVVDGDTIRVQIGGRAWVVSYIGINAPSTAGEGECFAVEATARNAELVIGKTVTLVPDISFYDWYGRLHMYVYVGDTFVNELLVRDGFAAARSLEPDIRYDALFAAAEADARVHERGMWGGC